MKTCKVRPTASDCRKCIDREEVLGVAISCQRCRYNTERYEIVGFVSGVFAKYALVNARGNVEAVNINRIYDIREESKDGKMD